MSVLIKGMEMPENCIECPLRKSTVCDAFQLIQPYTFKDDERAAFCPMTEVPEPKTGKWIIERYEKWWDVCCSQCGNGYRKKLRWNPVMEEFEDLYTNDYCSFCGSYNGGEDKR